MQEVIDIIKELDKPIPNYKDNEYQLALKNKSIS